MDHVNNYCYLLVQIRGYYTLPLPTEEEKREEERFLAELVKVPKMTAEEAKAFRREFYGEK